MDVQGRPGITQDRYWVERRQNLQRIILAEVPNYPASRVISSCSIMAGVAAVAVVLCCGIVVTSEAGEKLTSRGQSVGTLGQPADQTKTADQTNSPDTFHVLGQNKLEANIVCGPLQCVSPWTSPCLGWVGSLQLRISSDVFVEDVTPRCKPELQNFACGDRQLPTCRALAATIERERECEGRTNIQQASFDISSVRRAPMHSTL